MKEDQETDRMLWDSAARETAAVRVRLDKEFDKWPLIHFLTRHFGSLLFGASQKLIEKGAKTGESSARDQAVMFSHALVSSVSATRDTSL